MIILPVPSCRILPQRGSGQVLLTCMGRNKTLLPSTSLSVMGGYLHSSMTRARWAEGFHDELNGHMFDLERDGLCQVVPCLWLSIWWKQATIPYRISRRLGQNKDCTKPSHRRPWRTGKNGGNWLWNHLWCPEDPCGLRDWWWWRWWSLSQCEFLYLVLQM